MKIFGLTITTKKVVPILEAFALTETQKAVAALKTTTIGASVADSINALKNEQLSGTEKFERVVAFTLPLIATFVAGDGKPALKDVEDVGRALVQEIYNDVVSSKAATIATIILRLLGLK